MEVYDMSEIDMENPILGFFKASEKSIKKIFEILGTDWHSHHTTELVHYSSLQGLLGIVQSQGFWLSDIRFLNDVEEYDNGKIFSLDVIENFLKNSDYSYFHSVLKEAIKNLNEPLKSTYYIASFSKKKDNLEQWRAYANGVDGVALVFSNESKNMLSHFEIHPIMKIGKIIYDDETKLDVISKIIDIYANEYKNIDESTKVKYKATSFESDWADDMTGVLSELFTVFKNSAFEAEDEVRIIMHSVPIQRGGKLNYRIANGRIIPYFNSADLYDESFVEHYGTRALPLKEIIVGPIANQKITIESIEVFLKQMGYESVRVRASSVPYRG